MGASRTTTPKLVRDTCERLEKLLRDSPAYRKIEPGLYVIKQGSAMVMISVHAWRETHVVIRLTAQLVKGVTMEVPLALELLELNAILRFGAFAWEPKGRAIVFSHTLLEKALGDAPEFLDTVAAFAMVCDEYDDRIAARYGGSTMADLLEEETMRQLRRSGDEHAGWLR